MGFLDRFRAYGGEELPQVPEIAGTTPDVIAFGGEARADSVLAEPLDGAELMQMFKGEHRIGKTEALQIPTVAAALGLITGTMHRLPIKLYRREGDETKEISDDRRTHLLNVNPGDTLTSAQMMDALIEDYYLFGAGYCYVRRAGNDVQGLYYVENQEVCVIKNNEPIFKDYDLTVRGKRYLPHEFLKVLRASHDGSTGEGLLKRGNLLMQVIFNTMRFENGMVSRGGNKKGVVKSPKKLAPAAMEALKTAWENMYSNSTDSTVILNEGLDFKEISASSVELQLNENKKSNNLEICKLFGIPEGMLTGCGTSASSEDDKIKFVDYCILPLCAAIESALNRDLLTLEEQRSMFFKFDTDELSKGKLLERMQAYAVALKNNVYLLDEIREKENMCKLHNDTLSMNLGSVLYNPTTMMGFVPNTGETFEMSKLFSGKKEEDQDDES